MRSSTLHLNLNPILDEGAPTSTGGLTEATQMCDMIGMPLRLEAPRADYLHGWGIGCADARPIINSWDMNVNDINGKATTFTFDLMKGESPLIIGLDVKKYAITDNTSKPPCMRFKRPTDNDYRQFNTYIEPDDSDNNRIRLEIIPHSRSTVQTLMANDDRTDISLAKRLHRFTHASDEEMRRILTDANKMTPGLGDACTKVRQACDICASTGTPVPRRKISITHVNSAFNNEVQADFVTILIREERYEVLNIIDTGTRYGERVIAHNHRGDTMMNLFENEWIYHHGPPISFSADPEFGKGFFKKFLSSHGITLHTRPSRSSSKNGKVERNNGLFKNIINRLSKEITSATPSTLVARASFMANLFHGSSTLSAFQLARGYTPSIVGIPSTKVPEEMIQAHVENMANRAIQTILRSRLHETTRPSQLPAGTPVWVYFKTSKQNEPVRWIKATVADAGPHVVQCRRSIKGPPLTVSYEDIRIAPRGALTDELLSQSLEEAMADTSIVDDQSEDEERLPDNPPTEDNQSMDDIQDNEPPGPTLEPVPTQEETERPSTLANTDTLVHDIFGSEDGDDEQITKRTVTGTKTVQSMFTTPMTGSPEEDIGTSTPKDPPEGYTLTSDEQTVLKGIHDILGNEQVNKSKIGFAPPWVIEKAMKKEVQENWDTAYVTIKETDIPRSENIIGAHFVFKIKQEEDGTRRLKARLCPHGNRDKLKDEVRKDSATAQFDIIRLMISIIVILGFRMGIIDVKGAYLQSGNIRRKIYVRPPAEIPNTRGQLWLLTKLPYGITEAGRQWQKSVETWLIGTAGFERVFGVSQLFVKRGDKGKINMIVSKVTDDILMGGSVKHMEEFATMMKKRYEISKTIIDGIINFNGCRLSQDFGGKVEMSMEAYMASIKPIPVQPGRRKQPDCRATESEIESYRSLAGAMIWAGSGALPQAAYIGSAMQQQVPSLKVRDICEGNGMLKEMRDLKPIISFPRPSDKVKKVSIRSFSDAAFNITKKSQYGQTGIIIGLEYESENDEKVYHIVDWASVKQKRVSYSSYGAEILACTEADDRGFNIKMAIQSLTTDNTHVPHVLSIDSKGLYDTITTLHEGREYRLRQTVQRIRDSFESGELDTLRWVQGIVNIADALTKRNTTMHRMLNRIAVNGKLELPTHKSFELHSKEWT